MNMKLSDKEIIVFDMDGVIVDSVDLMFELTSKDFPDISREDFQNLFVGNLFDQLKVMEDRYGLPNREDEEFIRSREEYTKKKVSSSQMYPGIKELLTELKNLEKGLSLNTSAAPKNTLPLLDRLGITKLFDYIFTRGDSPLKIEKFRLIAECYGVNPKEFIFVTDSIGDIQESGELGIPTIAVTWGVHDRKHFEDNRFSNVIGIVDTVDELSLLLTQQV